MTTTHQEQVRGGTVARPRQEQSSHWYFPTGEPCHTVIAKSTKQPRPTTLADAKKLGLLPSVTNILKVLHKPALQNWLIEQAVLACLTTPRKDQEPLDTFVHRVLHEEKVQDQEAQVARERGTDMHAAMEELFCDRPIDDDIRPWIEPCFNAIRSLGIPIAVEKVLVGNGYAGKTDLITECAGEHTLWDFKTTKKLPDKSYLEHRLQLAAYAEAHQKYERCDVAISTANAYISTIECGKFVICRNQDWFDDYFGGFKPLVDHWQWANNYKP